MTTADRLRQAVANGAGMVLDHDAGAALADLLGAIRGIDVEWRAAPAGQSAAEWKRRIFDARDALEQAIS